MLLKIPQLLTKDQVASCKQVLLDADWADGNVTAGYQSAQAKHNLQLPENSPAARQLGDLVLHVWCKLHAEIQSFACASFADGERSRQLYF